MFYWGLIIGFVIGFTCGVLAIGFCLVAKDEEIEIQEKEIEG